MGEIDSLLESTTVFFLVVDGGFSAFALIFFSFPRTNDEEGEEEAERRRERERERGYKLRI